jgi:hypothetical protein
MAYDGTIRTGLATDGMDATNFSHRSLSDPGSFRPAMARRVLSGRPQE